MQYATFYTNRRICQALAVRPAAFFRCSVVLQLCAAVIAEQRVAIDLGLADGADLGLAAQLDGLFLDFLLLLLLGGILGGVGVLL